MYYNIDEVLKRKDEIFEIKYVKRKKVKIQMYEVTYSMNGVIKKIDIKADDAVVAQSIFTNMFGGGAVEIINIMRK
nr:MAG TPA: hypothetical protein [Caudoviricetes sp.]